MSDLLAQPVMHLFAVCSAILVLKMWLTGNCTGFLRVARGIFITSEDYAFAGKAEAAADPQIERLRRAHQNDLENILPFLSVGFLYALSEPSYNTAWWLFTIFTTGRVLHTVLYALALQPWRTIAFEMGNLSLLVMTGLLLVELL